MLTALPLRFDERDFPEITSPVVQHELENETADVLPLRFTNAGKKFYRRRMVERDPQCIYCGKTLTQETATLEHAIPQSKGGDHQPWNLFLACTACNSERSSRHIPDWVAEIRAKADRLEAAYLRMLGEWIDEPDERQPPRFITFIPNGDPS